MTRIFDASALLAVVFSERGDDEVLLHLAEAGGIVSAINWAETGSKMIDSGLSAKQVTAELAHFHLQVIAFDEAMALCAAELRSGTRTLGLSLGDRSCLALAQSTPGAIIVTADKAWKRLKDFDVRLIR